ncbi:hypothetical protein B0H15DRAFT_942408 [Mycena belliarum]|uniref:Uncharacterized protein n=1 Tax=Mycena belliarum TaxID=1033014 RepID=A0AAD6UM47_9AGAR|nr:hypothetical protein B0H15DRAFT_942408 [Mycena belliae]
MAFQTEASPTPSSSSGSAPDTSTNPASTLSGSPPLIIAFLAVGIFVISMVVFLGWRRVSYGRRRWVDPTDVDIAQASIGAPPKLWDVRGYRANTGEWHEIQPLAATVWDHTPRPTPVSADTDGFRHDGTLLAAALAYLRRSYRRQPDGSTPGGGKNAEDVQPAVRLQIAVTIAMPCPDSRESDNQSLEYSIGLYELAWEKHD